MSSASEEQCFPRRPPRLVTFRKRRLINKATSELNNNVRRACETGDAPRLAIILSGPSSVASFMTRHNFALCKIMARCNGKFSSWLAAAIPHADKYHLRLYRHISDLNLSVSLTKYCCSRKLRISLPFLGLHPRTYS